ncbi:MAG: hypothetical protein A3H28_11255 [Acidobacteria bacterium RIFCSPLOWO2_02_FULL_61_28]|nr:MAG: hypothetical protein A3H28_11255 [Acidobacteria bacterium RIFCSPLOWO2_02_FULL_61_28]
MPLTNQEMEAKLAALEDRVGLLTATVDTLETRWDQKGQEWADWSLLLHVLTEVIDRQLERDRGKTPGASPA